MFFHPSFPTCADCYQMKPTSADLLPANFCYIIQNVFTNYIFHDSAFKHNVSEIDIRTAFARPLFDGLLEDYDNKFLITGFDTRGNMLEIMYNLVDEHTVYVFHAMPCRKAFRMLRNQD